MSVISRFWLVLAVTLAALGGGFAIFIMASPTLDPGKFNYEAATLEGRVSILSYKGQPVLVIKDAQGLNHASRCNPYGREQGCVDLALLRGLQQGQQVEVGLLEAKFWPLADRVIVRLASNDHVFLGCSERLDALGVARRQISGIERIARC